MVGWFSGASGGIAPVPDGAGVHGGPGLDIRNRGGRHRRRAILEHLSRGWAGEQRQRKHQPRERPSAPPESNDTVIARNHGHAFH